MQAIDNQRTGVKPEGTGCSMAACESRQGLCLHGFILLQGSTYGLNGRTKRMNGGSLFLR